MAPANSNTEIVNMRVPSRQSWLRESFDSETPPYPRAFHHSIDTPAPRTNDPYQPLDRSRLERPQ